MDETTARSESDPSRFARLLQAHRDLVVRVAFRLLNGDQSAAEDLAQEVFLRFWSAGERYQERGSLRSYRLSITYRLASDLRRRTRTWETLDTCRHLAATAPDAAGEVEQQEQGQAVRQALAALPEEQRLVFILSHYEGLGYEEIAGIARCPVGTVASRKRLAVKRLRERLRPYFEGEKKP